jgi:hypothetical protein
MHKSRREDAIGVTFVPASIVKDWLRVDAMRLLATSAQLRGGAVHLQVAREDSLSTESWHCQTAQPLCPAGSPALEDLAS